MAEHRFEEALQRLEQIVEDLEGGELPLEEALQVFEEGMKLIQFCSKKLEEAEKKVTLLVQQEGGRYTQTPFEMEPEEDEG
jgi:exodeoxyribonuclease VII small subunit